MEEQKDAADEIIPFSERIIQAENSQEEEKEE